MRRLIRVFVAVSMLLGCSVDSSASESEAASASVGVLHVDRAPADGSGRTVLRAAFARYQGIDSESVLGLLGTGSQVELGTCAIVERDEPLAADADVELLDVGSLGVRVAGTEARLSPRTFPDLASVLAGVFYAGDAALAMPRPEVDAYRFTAEGGFEVGAFDVLVPAPAEPTGLALVGGDGSFNAPLEVAVTPLARNADLTVSWDGGDARDRVEVEIAAAGQTLACLARDEGALRIEATVLGQLGADGDARMTVRRVRVSPFEAEGIDAAYARVAASRSFAVAVR